uniref:uncharacterized protein LOC106993242 isoform X3 n=1 Tax=Macaca mulatta TaxID=9544 RepID=UPI0010A255E9|nr:uncharacterized protein LOC106993242 isoform X3 [Macaca mulatta]
MHPTCWTEPLLAFLNPEKLPGSRMKQRVPGTHTGLTTTHEISDDCPHSPALQGEIKTKAIFRPKGGREEACRAHPCEEVRTRPFWKPPQARRLCVLSHFILEQLWEEVLRVSRLSALPCGSLSHILTQTFGEKSVILLILPIRKLKLQKQTCIKNGFQPFFSRTLWKCNEYKSKEKPRCEKISAIHVTAKD